MGSKSLSYYLAAAKERLLHLLPRQPRRIHVYGVGAGKTGTNSVHEIFESNFRSAHEPEAAEFVHFLERFDRGEVSLVQKINYLVRRDRRLNLEMDSSAMNRRVAGLLAELFPESKFILTVRDPYTRTDSMINMLLNLPTPSPLAQSRRDRLFGGAEYRHAPEEKALAERGLHTLDGYLADYAQINAGIKKTIPADRLLVVRTDKLFELVPSIAQFLGIDQGELDFTRVHAHKTTKKHGILSAMDPDFVDKKVHAHCSELLSEYFPEIKSIRDVMHFVFASTGLLTKLSCSSVYELALLI